MDWVIGGAILVAFTLVFKLVRDINNDKPLKRLKLLLDIALILLPLLFAIFARLNQSDKDSTRHSEVLDGQKNGTAHTDTGLKKLNDADSARIRHFEDTLKNRAPSSKEILKEPEIQMMPYKGELNPVIASFSNDSIHAFVFLRNFGSATAQDIHFQYHFFIRNRVGKGWSATPENDHSCTLVADPEYYCRFELGYKGIPLSTDTVYILISYCYKDTNGKCFGPIKYMVYFTSPFIVTTSANAVSQVYENIRKYLLQNGMWPTKCF